MNVVLEELKTIQHKPVIVEGKNDRKSLRLLGFDDVHILNQPLYKIIEEFPHDEVIILTDLDQEGKRLYGKLKKGFAHHGVHVDDTIRELLFKETQLRQIEGIYNYLKRHTEGLRELI
jgi:5S rRNA maturation endonuclease (ribonuclease M5)